MKYCADLHIHSPYSRGTSPALSLAELAAWARIKGVNLVGTGDFTHPQWRALLKENLIPDGRGFFALKDRGGVSDPASSSAGFMSEDIPIRFCLSAEISSIYKKNDATRKVHSLIFAPDLDKAERISVRLAAIGNVVSDGRPILGLDPKNLLEIIKEVDPACHLIPAHIWTPWFSVFGAHSGFDSLQECFEDMLPHVFALETGLSSDPLMNERVSALDRYTLVSNSDAHSGPKLMREATLFDTELSYEAMFRALATREGFAGTIEFFPAEGKYHYDGHRACGVVLSPEETWALARRAGGNAAADERSRCPTCGKPLTIGVLHRVLDLADRPADVKPARPQPFRSVIPLPEMLSELADAGPSTKTVQTLYRRAIAAAGSERQLLLHMPIEDIRRTIDEWLALAVRRLREGKVFAQPGYDGEFGVIRVFEPGELERLRGQAELFHVSAIPRGLAPRNEELFKLETKTDSADEITPAVPSEAGALTEEQRAVVNLEKGAGLVLAGPGTGKTRTLLHWIAHLVEDENVAPRSIVAFTFTHKAKDELAARLRRQLGERAAEITVSTFHAFCFDVITAWYPEVKSLYDETGRRSLLRFLYPGLNGKEVDELSQKLEKYLDGTGGASTAELDGIAAAYQEALKQVRGVDVAGLISSVNLIFESRPEILNLYRGRFQAIAVDEFQDTNRTQYRFLGHLIGQEPGSTGRRLPPDKRVLVIGDPDQSIYGFRGADASLFFRFQNDYRAAYASLSLNYRSTAPIIAAARALIEHNSLKSGLKLKARSPGGAKLAVAAFADQEAEAEHAAALIRGLVGGLDLHAMETTAGGRPYSFGDIAVLARTHRALEPAVRACLRHNIPAAFRSGRALLAEPAYSVLAEVLRYFMNKEDVVAFQNIIAHFLPGLTREGLAAVIAAFKAAGGDPAALSGTEEILAALSGVERRGLEEVFRFLEFTEVEIETQGAGKGLRLLLEKIRGQRPLTEDEAINDLALVEMAAGYGADIPRFIREVLLSPREVGFGFPVERVSFLTFHAAKGLEFPAVIIVAAEEGIAPQTRSDSDLEEERRLFYVALTRAGERVFISHALRRESFGRETTQAPSRFLQEMPDDVLEKSTVKIKKKSYSQPSLF